jgi:outer membrane protein TolC
MGKMRYCKSMQVKPAVVLVLMATIVGCSTYRAKPLPLQPTLSREVPHLTIEASQMPLPELATHRFDPSDGLDMTEVAMLAVINNPDLKIARDEAGIASAQAFAAGLLPDPQLTASADFPTGDVPGSNYTAYSYGLNYDIGALLIRSSAIAAAGAEKRKTDLNLLWHEWQVVAQARLLFIRNMEQARLMKVLLESRELLVNRYEHSRKALADGNVTLDAATIDFSALQDLDRQINELQRQQRQNGFALNALLGLAPDITLHLVGESQLPGLNTHLIEALIKELPSRRPDLLALKAGYESQDQRLRQAIIAQFPSLNIGVTRARDTSDVKTVGVGVTFNLPLFNRNQGNIATEEATRQRLYDEFQARLNSSAGEIQSIVADQSLLQRQLTSAREGVTAAQDLATKAETAYRAGNITETAYISLRSALLWKRQEEIALEGKILEQRVALQTLIGGEIPTNPQH